MFLKRMRECEIIPFGYRVAYWDAYRNFAVCAPLGVHYLVRVLFHLWLYSHRYKPSKWEKLLNTAYWLGYDQGVEDNEKRLGEDSKEP